MGQGGRVGPQRNLSVYQGRFTTICRNGKANIACAGKKYRQFSREIR